MINEFETILIFLVVNHIFKTKKKQINDQLNWNLTFNIHPKKKIKLNCYEAIIETCI